MSGLRQTLIPFGMSAVLLSCSAQDDVADREADLLVSAPTDTLIAPLARLQGKLVYAIIDTDTPTLQKILTPDFLFVDMRSPIDTFTYFQVLSGKAANSTDLLDDNHLPKLIRETPAYLEARTVNGDRVLVIWQREGESWRSHRLLILQ
jgi:hypothetical protein